MPHRRVNVHLDITPNTNTHIDIGADLFGVTKLELQAYQLEGLTAEAESIYVAVHPFGVNNLPTLSNVRGLASKCPLFPVYVGIGGTQVTEFTPLRVLQEYEPAQAIDIPRGIIEVTLWQESAGVYVPATYTRAVFHFVVTTDKSVDLSHRF